MTLFDSGSGTALLLRYAATVKPAINDQRYNDNLDITINFAATVPFVWESEQYNDILAIGITIKIWPQFNMVIVILVRW